MSDAELKTYENTPQIELAEIYSFNIARQKFPSDKKGRKEVHEELKRKQKSRRESGLGRAPITFKTQDGYLGQVVGDDLLLSKKWKTFHDFLLEYIALVLGREWGAAELKKHQEEQHQIIHLFGKVRAFQNKQIASKG